MAIVDKPVGDGDGHAAPATLFGGRVEQVLASPRIAPRARDARGGAEGPRARGEDRGADAEDRGGGHQVRLLPAGLDHRPGDGQGRGLDVLPPGRRARLPARLRRHRQPVHRPLRQLHRVRPRGVRARGGRRPRHVRRAARGTRASRASSATATTPRPASCSTPTPARTSSGSPHEFEQELGYHFLIGIEPEMMWLKRGDGGRRARGRDQALLLPHPPVRGAPSGAARRRRLRPGARTRHELRRPRGRPRPARAQLPLRPAAAHGRQHHHLPPGVRRRGPQARPAPELHAEAVHRRLGQRPPPPLHADGRRAATTSSTIPTARRSCRRSPATSSAGCSSTSRR